VPCWFDNNEGSQQILFAMLRKYRLEFSVHGRYRSGDHAQIDDAGLQVLYKHQIAVISVASQKDPPVRLSNSQNVFVASRGKVKIGGRRDIVPTYTQQLYRCGIHILIGEKSHPCAVK